MKKDFKYPLLLGYLLKIKVLNHLSMITKLLVFCLCGLIFIRCSVGSPQEFVSNVDFKKEIQGVWRYQEKDTTYSEVVISDNIYWGYDDMFGVLSYNYELGKDSVLKRYYKETGNPFPSLVIKEFLHDTIRVVGNNNFQYTFYRLKLSLDLNKIVKEDTAVIDDYILGFRERKNKWEAKRRR